VVAEEQADERGERIEQRRRGGDPIPSASRPRAGPTVSTGRPQPFLEAAADLIDLRRWSVSSVPAPDRNTRAKPAPFRRSS
jgi:hypothetical protein